MSKKVLWYVSNLTVAGGGERYILEAIKYLEKKNIKTTVICNNYNRKAFFDNSYNVDVCQINKNNNKANSKALKVIYEFYGLYKILKSKYSDLILCQDSKGYAFVFLVSILLRRKYSVIDFGQLYQMPESEIIYSLLYRKKTLLIENEIVAFGEKMPKDSVRRGGVNKILREIKSIIYYLAYCYSKDVFVLSEKVKREDYILYNKKCKVIRGAYDDGILEYQRSKNIKEKYGLEEKYLILSLGRLVKHKRVDLLIESFIELLKHKKSNEFVLMIAGEGEEKESLISMTHKYGVKDQVIFAGFIPEVELLDTYLSCDLFITLDSADFDITPYMALALKKKIVVPKIMEFHQSIKEYGLIYQTYPNAAHIAETISKAIDGDTNKGIYEDKYRDVMSSYTWNNCFNELYKSI